MLERGDRDPDGERRAALLRLSALCGLALTGDVLAAVAAPAAPDAAPEYLRRDELALTGVLAELIIPRTDTPGAREAGAHRTIDHLLARCTPAAEAQAFRAGLARIDAIAQAQGGKHLTDLPAARQVALLHLLDKGAAPFTAADRAFFRHLKGHVAFAYYTSEPGATQELAYLAVPGGYSGIKVTPATRTWAL